MKRLLIGLMLLTGCAGWNVRAFDVPLNGRLNGPNAGYHAAIGDDPGTLSTEEKWGVVLLLGIAVAGGVLAATGN